MGTYTNEVCKIAKKEYGLQNVFSIGVLFSICYFMYGNIFDEEFGVVSIPTNFS